MVYWSRISPGSALWLLATANEPQERRGLPRLPPPSETGQAPSLQKVSRAPSQRLRANSQQRPYIPPSKIFFDRYRSAESGISVTTRFPAPRRLAISTAA